MTTQNSISSASASSSSFDKSISLDHTHRSASQNDFKWNAKSTSMIVCLAPSYCYPLDRNKIKALVQAAIENPTIDAACKAATGVSTRNQLMNLHVDLIRALFPKAVHITLDGNSCSKQLVDIAALVDERRNSLESLRFHINATMRYHLGEKDMLHFCTFTSAIAKCDSLQYLECSFNLYANLIEQMAVQLYPFAARRAHRLIAPVLSEFLISFSIPQPVASLIISYWTAECELARVIQKAEDLVETCKQNATQREALAYCLDYSISSTPTCCGVMQHKVKDSPLFGSALRFHYCDLFGIECHI